MILGEGTYDQALLFTFQVWKLLNVSVAILIFVNYLQNHVYQKTDMKTFVMEVVLSHIHCSQKQTSLQIQLYYDDFETANPLGSKLSVHKVGALYFVLRNLPPKLNSVLMNINLVALFHAEDVKKCGFDPILQPLIDDIKILESHGIDLPFSSEKVNGTICLRF